MRSGALPWKLLVQLTFVLLVNFTSAGNLDFYQDVEPELPEDVPYKQMARYLESSKNHEPRGIQRPRMLPNWPWTYDEYLDNRRLQEKILETLLENPAILDVLQNEKMKNREEVVHWPRAYDTPEDYPRGNEAGPRPYMSANPAPSRFEDYSNVKIPFAKNFLKNEKPYYVHGSGNLQRSNPLMTENYPAEDMEAERLLKLQGKLMDLDANRERAEEAESPQVPEQEFTFKFNDPEKNERDTFAIRPNDPRYYQDDSSATSVATNEETTSRVEKVSEPMDERFDPFPAVNEEPKSDAEYATEGNMIRDKFSLMKVIIPDRRAERDPLVVSSTRMTNNDIYFIAIVAGCSAAAMFALVLIALTWCRLHRGAKAAADIEYPAYGVTGPNKDISPSGDQRLAHSAQMYHFQHQKQQIIAMENRTAASRDPGSVSEAESDEENEEGDYTVYECPGLASTAEMEVKNPMFHDDPTPATPPQNHKEEDHM